MNQSRNIEPLASVAVFMKKASAGLNFECETQTTSAEACLARSAVYPDQLALAIAAAFPLAILRAMKSSSFRSFSSVRLRSLRNCSINRLPCRCGLRDIRRALTPVNVGHWRWCFAVIKELVERNFEGAGKFFNRFKCRNRVPILHTRDIAPQQSCAVFNFPLRQVLFFAKRLVFGRQ